MELNKFKKIQELANNDKNFWKFGFIIVVIISVINYKSITDIKNNEKIVIKTISQSSPFWISSIDADEKYLINLGAYITQLLENYTSANIAGNYKRLLELAHSANFTELKAQFKNSIEKSKKYNRNSFSFYITKTEVNKKTKQIIISGNSTRWSINGKKTPKKKKIIIDYTIENSQFLITKIKRIKG